MYTSLMSPASRRSGNQPPPDDETHPVMLSPERAIELLGMRLGIIVGRSTFYRWVYTGRFFSVKLGGKLFIPLSEMEMVVQRLANGERL
jgi:hypothetical protein